MPKKRERINTSFLEKKYTKEELSRKMQNMDKILRGYQLWRERVAADGLYTITYEGEEYHFFDILNGFRLLPPRQREAVYWFCIQDQVEKETASKLGLTKSSKPVSQYKRDGIKKLIAYQELQEASRR